MIREALRSPRNVMFMMAGFAILLRFFSFFPSVMDHDESTYIVIADALRHGQVYLRDVVDTKPIGIFALFALLQSVFGKSILVIRIITAVWVGLTGWMLYLIHRLLVPATDDSAYHPGAIASGMMYIFMTSTFTFFGVSPNTELFFVLFTVIALYLLLRQTHLIWIFIAGLLLGMGFMIKYVVAFDALAIGLFYIWKQVVDGKTIWFWLSRCVIMGVGFLLPLAGTWWYYDQLGMRETFMFFTFELSGRYFTHPTWHAYVTFMLDGMLRYLPVTLMFLWMTRQWRVNGPALAILSWLWIVLVTFVILMPGRMFYHYFIQAMVPLTLLAGGFFNDQNLLTLNWQWLRKPAVMPTIVIVLLVGNILIQKKDYFDKPDYQRQAAEFLKPKLKPEDIIYTANSHQIIYHLTDRLSPTPYVHPSLLWHPKNVAALGIDQEQEWRKILEQQPRYILLGKPSKELDAFVEAMTPSYHSVISFGKDVHIYEKN